MKNQRQKWLGFKKPYDALHEPPLCSVATPLIEWGSFENGRGIGILLHSKWRELEGWVCSKDYEVVKGYHPCVVWVGVRGHVTYGGVRYPWGS